jgi:hypothetical protein
MNDRFVQFTIKSWDYLKSLQTAMPILWAFRGQGDNADNLTTSFERKYEKRSSKFRAEKEILEAFKRRASNYLQYLPAYERNLEWLALLQHHGCPTRLLDFSESFYVAAFFALENAKKDAAVWAINLSKLHSSMVTREICQNIPDDRNERRSYLNNLAEKFINYDCKENPENNLIIDVVPEVLNERIAIQQGIFLFPTNVNIPFIENFAENDFKIDISDEPIKDELTVSQFEEILRTAKVIKFILKKQCHERALFDLYRMNITFASLFPGLDGFARSLAIYTRTDYL